MARDLDARGRPDAVGEFMSDLVIIDDEDITVLIEVSDEAEVSVEQGAVLILNAPPVSGEDGA